MLAVVLLLPTALTAPALAQFSDPGAERDPSGRTPRQPRRPNNAPTTGTTAGPTTDTTQTVPVATAPPSVGELGATPPAPVGVARSSVRSHVETDERAIALTLDDGYNPDPRVLELIESYGVHGTAFIVGEVADTNPWLLNELARLGWLVCSHSYTHAQLTNLSDSSIRSEMVRGIEAVERVVGYKCPYFRAPYGSVDSRVAAIARDLGVEIIGWDASISDSAPKGTDPALQLKIAQNHIRPGSILLGHFGSTNSYIVLKNVLSWLYDEGYRVGSVAELIAGTIAELRPSSEVTEVGGPGRSSLAASAVLPLDATATRPRSLSATEIAIDVFGVAFLLTLARRRYIPRRRQRARPAEALA